MSEVSVYEPTVTRVRTVRVIPPSIQPLTGMPAFAVRPRRVAAYARVSTNSEEQLTSYEAQVKHYTEYIQSKEQSDNWKFVSVYTEMLTPSMIQMHPACVQTALKMHTAPQAVCICRIFGVFSGCILEIKVHPSKIHVHIAQKKSCAGVRSQAVKSKKKILSLHPNGG